jgi:hypothetical protein
MANNQKKGPGGHYSGSNPIPNIQRFIESMDADKKDRDAKINHELSEKQKLQNTGSDEIRDHDNGQPTGVEGTRKKVTDPTTGKEVEIEDVNADFMKAVENPQLSVPNANLGKETVSFFSIHVPMLYADDIIRRRRQILSSPGQNIKSSRTLPHHQTQSSRVVLLMCPFMEKRRISCSIRRPPSLTNPCMQHWRRGLQYYAL